MVAEAGAEVLLIGEVRPNADGIEISYRAFRVKGTGTGNVVASSKPRVMAMDWKKELGATPIQIADTMKEMAEAMKRLAASGGLVADPKTPAEFYHNARILAQRGEVDLALGAYEKLADFPISFADPIQDVLTLAIRVYGKEGARSYFSKKYSSKLSPDVLIFASQLLSDTPSATIEKLILAKQPVFIPAVVSFIVSSNVSSSNFSDISFYGNRRAVFNGIELLKKSYDSGEFFQFYIDQLRAEKDYKSVSDLLEKKPPFERERDFYAVEIAYSSDRSSFLKRFIIRDFVKNVSILCYLTETRKEKCVKFSEVAVLTNSQYAINNRSEFVFRGSNIRDTDKPLCITGLEYSDMRDVSHKLNAAEINYRYRADRIATDPLAKSDNLKEWEKIYSLCVGSQKADDSSSIIRGVGASYNKVDDGYIDKNGSKCVPVKETIKLPNGFKAEVIETVCILSKK
jgi:hypothetical protein